LTIFFNGENNMQHCVLKTTTILLITVLQAAQPVTAVEKLLVYAAASTSNAISEIIDHYNEVTSSIQVKASFASSSTLAKQIEAGAPVHIYISANPTWMDFLQERNLIISESRLNLLSNKLVLVTPLGKGFAVEMQKDFDLAGELKGKLCLGDPGHVPAGIYAKQALTSLGWWDKVKPSVVGTKDVRATLALVERGECAAGIIYSTDASSSKKIELLDELPADSHNPVVYPVATLVSAPDSAQVFLNFLSTSQAKAIFEKHGFNTYP
jgi:molybdate transport system substrate-binding protein